MSTKYERCTGKLVGPRFDQNPWPWRGRRIARTAGAALDVPPEPKTDAARSARDLERIQATRPLKPPRAR